MTVRTKIAIACQGGGAQTAFTAGALKALLEAGVAEEFDIVAITGDLVDGSVAEIGDVISEIGRLRSRYGVTFVTGNHEYYSGVHAWLAELKRLDVRVLLNEHVVLEHDDATLVVAGVAVGVRAHRMAPNR